MEGGKKDRKNAASDATFMVVTCGFRVSASLNCELTGDMVESCSDV